MTNFFRESDKLRDDFEEFGYEGKRFVLRQIHFLRDYEKEGFFDFRCPHCNAPNVINHQEIKPCTKCHKLLAVEGGAFYYELD